MSRPAKLSGMEASLSRVLQLKAAAVEWFLSLPSHEQYVWAAAVGIASYAACMWVVRTCERRALAAPPACKSFDEHGEDVKRVLEEVRSFLATRKEGQGMSINRSRGGHSDSNRTIDALYKKTATRVDVSRLDCVLGVDAVGKGGHPLLHMEPGLPMDEMARIALAHGFVPQVVMEFPGITVGGGICGGGIESSSHAYGCFFDTVEEVDIITGDGVYRQNVSRTHEPDLFAALNTTYGTVGVLTRVAVRLEVSTKYVRVRYLHADGMHSASAAMVGLSNADAPPAFIDGVCLSPTSAMVVVGDYTDAVTEDAPLRTLRQHRSDPWFFWHLTTLARASVPLPFLKCNDAGAPKRSGAFLRNMACASETVLLEDYLFRFDRGAFWMARHGLALFWGAAAYREAGPHSGPDWWVRVKYAWLATTRQLYRMLHKIGDEMLARHYVVQDYIMPDGGAASELVKYTGHPSMGIWPLWLCPVRMVDVRHPCSPGFGFPVQQTPKGGIMVNVGVYGMPNGGAPFDPVVVNKGLEGEATRLGGRKMLYAQSFYSAQEFGALFDRRGYDAVRVKYGCVGVFPDASTKLLLGPDRIAQLGGVKPVSFLSREVAGGMASWYATLHLEVLLPRFLHTRAVGIEHTSMTEYVPYGEGAPSRLHPSAAMAAMERIGQALGAEGSGAQPPRASTPSRTAAAGKGEVEAPFPTVGASAKKVPSGRKRAGTGSRA